MKKVIEAALVIHLWIIAAIAPLLVKVFSLKRILKFLTPPFFLRPYRGISAEEVARRVENRLKNPICMVRRACLREGLLLFHFLKLAGLEATLHVSIHPREMTGRFHAHCWVTSSGRIVSSPPGPQMIELFSHS